MKAISAFSSHYEKLPAGWEVARLSDVANIVMGQSPSGDAVTSNINGVEFHQGKIYFTDRVILPSGLYTNESNKIADKGSVLLCVRAPVGIVNITQREIAIGRGLCSLTPLGNISVNFLFNWLTAFRQSFVEQAMGTTFQAITSDVVHRQSVPVPPLAEQLRIISAIESAYEILDVISSNIR
jgi:type I restriction enzyme S subunit